MKSIKPGRGPSMMSGIGCLFAALFGIVWTAAAMSGGAPIFFALFGLFFIGAAAVQAVYNFKNAAGKNRHSLYDITGDGEEPDPWDEHFRPSAPAGESAPPQDGRFHFCPYCGAKLGEGFTYCGKCGRQLPDE